MGKRKKMFTNKYDQSLLVEIREDISNYSSKPAGERILPSDFWIRLLKATGAPSYTNAIRNLPHRIAYPEQKSMLRIELNDSGLKSIPKEQANVPRSHMITHLRRMALLLFHKGESGDRTYFAFEFLRRQSNLSFKKLSLCRKIAKVIKPNANKAFQKLRAHGVPVPKVT